MSSDQEFYYYTKGPKRGGAWTAVPTTSTDRLESPRVGFRTVLACSAKVRPGKAMPDPESTLYRGPFYIDIDSDNQRTALSTARKAVDALRNVGIRDEDIYVWLSGQKGYHIVVPQECFLPDEPTLSLPRIYKYIAADLKLPIDHSVYSMGRGRMWRLVNRKRDDNGLYKVAISLDELRSMQAADYREMCREPRPDHEIRPGVRAKGIQVRVARAQARAAEDRKVSKIFVDPDTLAMLEDEEYRLPPCGQMLVHGEVRQGLGFNEVSVQFAKVLASFGGDDPDSLIQEFSENNRGDSYNTPEKRATHVRSALPAAKTYPWSCRSALSALPYAPCENCPVAYMLTAGEESEDVEEEGLLPTVDLDDIDPAQIPTVRLNGAAKALPPVERRDGVLDEIPDTTIDLDHGPVEIPTISAAALARPAKKKPAAPAPAKPKKQKQKQESIEEVREERELPDVDYQFDLANSHSLVADERGYGFLADKGTIRYVCNFTLRFIKVFSEWKPELQETRRVAVMCEVYQGFKSIGRLVIEEGAWETKGSFLKCLAGVSNLSFHGKDDDVQKMKEVLMERVNMHAEHVRKVHAYGIHHEVVAGNDVFTYVEPGWSIDNTGAENTFSLLGNKPQGAPLLAFTEPLEKGDPEARKALRCFMTLNEPVPAAQITGWVFACFLKRHIEAFRDWQFPLINVYGNASSGKTQGMMRWCQLFGVSWGRHDTINAANARDFQIWKSLSDSETSAAILDEYNISKLGQKRYIHIGEYVKEAYQRGAVQRGVLTSDRSTGKSAFGAELTSFSLCTPLAICSEQAMTNMPALVTRAVQIPIRPKGLDWNGSTPRDSFRWIGENREIVEKLSKHLYMMAIHTPIAEVKAAYEELDKDVPVTLGDRPKHCYSTLLTGLWFLRRAVTDLELGIEQEVDELSDQIRSLFAEGSSFKGLEAAKVRSEIDIVLDTMGVMAMSIHDADFTRDALKPDLHYKVIDGVVWLNLQLSFSAYRRYMNTVERATPVISTPLGFVDLARNEPYFVGARKIDGLGNGQPCIGLSIAEMQLKGIAAENFLLLSDDD